MLAGMPLQEEKDSGLKGHRTLCFLIFLHGWMIIYILLKKIFSRWLKSPTSTLYIRGPTDKR